MRIVCERSLKVVRCEGFKQAVRAATVRRGEGGEAQWFELKVRAANCG